MPWSQTCVMEERIKFIMEVLDGTYNMSDLCGYYGISRKNGYKWLSRYQQGGIEALHDQSRMPHCSPNQMSDQTRQAILAVKKQFPKWGAPKIRKRLETVHPRWKTYPAISTIGLFLNKQGLTCPIKRRRKPSPSETPLTNGLYSNHVWCADFKGHFHTGDGIRCNPLTITDHASRYLLCCRHVNKMGYGDTKIQFERVFREYGLPQVIRTDNGVPFGSVGLGGLSRLSYWWIRLGIYPQRIEPGHPEQNGTHERMHKTLKAHTAKSPASTIAQQQKRFDDFCVEFNDYRPHQAIEMKTPSQFYSRSLREFPSRLPAVIYLDHMLVRIVQKHGDIFFNGKRLFLTESLSNEYVGIERVDEDISNLWYCDYLLGRIDHRKWRVEPTKNEPFISAVNCGDKQT